MSNASSTSWPRDVNCEAPTRRAPFGNSGQHWTFSGVPPCPGWPMTLSRSGSRPLGSKNFGLRRRRNRLDARLAAGDEANVVAEAERLVAEHPLRERLWALLMLAEYRLGRQSEALRSYSRLRQLLAEELGIEPSPELQALELQILEQDPSLAEIRGLEVLSPHGVTTPVRNPYKGLRAFEEADAGDFFGRDDLVRKLRLALDRRGASRLVMLAGPSGTGKSSVVRAGLLSGLIAEGRSVAAMYPGIHPMTALAQAVTDLKGDGSVLVVDQFEELFTLVSEPGQRVAFLTAIADLATRDDGPWIVATIRADYLDELMAHAGLASLLDQALMLVPPMSEHEIRSARGGTRRGGWGRHRSGVGGRYHGGHHGTSVGAAAPTVCTHRPSSTVATGDRSPGTRTGRPVASWVRFARRADELYDSLDESGRATARRAFLRMVSMTSDGEPVRKRVGRSDLADLAQADGVLDAFGANRLVTFDRTPHGEPTIEVAHEALLRDWPLLRDWIEEARFELVAPPAALGGCRRLGRPSTERRLSACGNEARSIRRLAATLRLAFPNRAWVSHSQPGPFRDAAAGAKTASSRHLCGSRRRRGYCARPGSGRPARAEGSRTGTRSSRAERTGGRAEPGSTRGSGDRQRGATPGRPGSRARPPVVDRGVSCRFSTRRPAVQRS